MFMCKCMFAYFEMFPFAVSVDTGINYRFDIYTITLPETYAYAAHPQSPIETKRNSFIRRRRLCNSSRIRVTCVPAGRSNVAWSLCANNNADE